ncbi:MAG: YfbR-like 5'-deoxynucleotidase [Parasphingorhabdus sp.]|uniref:YfbR-like 5'-deoxynucleotidase n=1 Tax=Parasphingorhabdus sp. TaxID=2709688 RepID=UPI003298C416
MADTCIMLASGALFDFLEPEASDFTLNDIAHGLGRVCRFAGQSSSFYSVAEHCFHVARLVPVEHARAALLHDASEAFLGDVTRPLKSLLPDYKKIEERVEDAIAKRFLPGFNTEAPREMFRHPLIKQADIAMCVAEAKQLMPETNRFWTDQSDAVKSQFPADWDRATSARLNMDKPEYATAKWLRAWNRYGHWELELQEQGEAA